MAQYKDIVTTYVIKYPGINNTQLADLILSENPNIGKSHRTIRYCIGSVRTEQATLDAQDGIDENMITEVEFEDPSDNFAKAVEKSMSITDEELFIKYPDEDVLEEDDNVEEEEEEPGEEEPELEDIPDIVQPIYFSLASEEFSCDAYEVKNLVYKLVVSKVEYLFDVELVDRVFCAYSRKGLNLTKNQITNNLNLSVNELSAIMNKLNLTKDSEPFGPFTDEFMEREDIYSVTVSNATSLLDAVKETDSAALEAVIKAYKKAYVEYTNKNLRHDSFMTELVEGVKALNLKPITKEVVVVSNENAPEILNVVLTDMHLGLQLPVYNYGIAEEKLNKIANDINRVGAKSVTISFLGDTIHTVTGNNHAGMWKTIEQGAWGANSIIKPFEILYKFLSKINNLHKVTSVSGNHDRLQADKELEDTNEGAKLLFYMLSISLQGIEIIHTAHKTIFEANGLLFINMHGDQGLDKKSADKIVWKNGKQDKFNLILEGHWHSRIISKEDDCGNYRKMHCPAFAPTDDYADRLGLGSASGWLMIVEEDGLPRITDIPINYGTILK